MSLLKKGDVAVESLEVFFLDLPRALLALHLKESPLLRKSSVLLFDKVVVALPDQGLGFVLGLLEVLKHVFVLWNILVSFGLAAQLIDISRSKCFQNINLLSADRVEDPLELLLSGLELSDGFFLVSSENAFARRLRAVVSASTSSTSTSASAISIEVTATTTSTCSGASSWPPRRASCWTAILAWSLTSRSVSSFRICTVVDSLPVVVERPVAPVFPLFVRGTWIKSCVMVGFVLLAG